MEASDADIARTLARALVVHRIQASRDWGTVLEHLGLRSEELNEAVGSAKGVALQLKLQEEETERQVFLDSVKRKRRKKMNKHKCVPLKSFPCSIQAYLVPVSAGIRRGERLKEQNASGWAGDREYSYREA
jgi:hypothetical protein